MNTTVDALTTALYELLRDASGKPAGLGADQVLDHDLLPTAEEDLPVVGVYLVEDAPADSSDSQRSQQRRATVRVEIRCIGKMLQTTQPFREWVLATVGTDATLDALAESVEYGQFKPFGIAGDNALVGADLDFEFFYIWSPA